jgi:penicillin amidase
LVRDAAFYSSSSVYGASLPGSPFIIIGFNDHVAWGVTNAQRDVKDYYQIKFKDASKQEYWYNGQWQRTQLRVEEIKVKGAATVYDTVAYTAFGPVMFDKSFPDTVLKKSLAVRWTGHDASNEGMTFYKLNRAKNYDDYVEAIRHIPARHKILFLLPKQVTLPSGSRENFRRDGGARDFSLCRRG